MNRISLFIFSLLLSVFIFAKDPSSEEKGYTINFENVELKELLQFVSRIGNLNLIYNESEVGFNITFVSDRPTSLNNVKSALVQILRIKGLSLIEDGNNLIIHKNPAIKQIPTVVSKENPLKGETPAIITQVFKIHRGNPTNIAALITPLLSTSAMVEVSLDTRQLIVTDVASSIATVKQLLKSLDVPETPYDIDTYEAVNMNVLELEVFAKKIMAPFTDNTILEIIPRPEANTLYIISTPFLIDRTISVLEEVDTDLTIKQSGYQKLSGSNVLIYPLIHKNHEAALQILKKVIKESKNQGLDPKSLESIIKSGTYVKSTHSLVFIGPPSDLSLLYGLLKNIDTKNNFLGTEDASFYLFDPKGMNIDDVISIIEEISENLEENNYPNQTLLHVLKNCKPIHDLNSILFIVPPDTKPDLVTFLNSILSSYNVDINRTGISHFLLYNIKLASEEQMRDSLNNLQEYLKNNDYPNENLIKTIASIKWIKASNSLFFVGNTKSLNELANILPTFDVATSKSQEILTQSPPSTEFMVYTPLNLNVEDLKDLVIDTANKLESADLSDPSFMKCLESVKILEGANQLLFTGVPQSLTRLQILLQKLDVTIKGNVKVDEEANNKNKPIFKDNLLIYPLKSNGLSAKEIISELKEISKISRKTKGLSNLFKSIETVRYVKGSNSLVFVGDDDTLTKINELLKELDHNSLGKKASSDRSVEGYQIYVPQHLTGPELVQRVTSFEAHLINSGMTNEPLSEVIDHLSYVQLTNTIIVSGEKESVQEVIALLKQFDNSESSPNKTEETMETINEQGFLLYKIQNVKGNEIVAALNSISSNLKKQPSNSLANKQLIRAIGSIQWIETTNSLIATGVPNILTKLEQLLKSIDRPLKQVFIEVLVIDTTLTDTTTFGLTWANQGTIDNRFGYNLGNTNPESTSPDANFVNNFGKINQSTTPSGAAIPALGGGYMGIIGDIIFHNGKSYSSIGSLLNALKTEGDTTVVLSQKIVTQDNQNAKIFSGDNVPFTGSLVTTSGLTQTSNANLEYRNIGVTLSITPNISSEGMITLDIDEEISEEANLGQSNTEDDVDTRTINGIRTTKTNMTTRIRVPDKHFLILSGTMRNTVTRSVSGIPCLGGLPLIGAAFSKTEKDINNRNLIMFVKPHIIETNQTHVEITKNQEHIYSNADQCNIEDFNDGLELVRSPSDVDKFEEEYDYDD